jgi:hypothetical protein
MNPANDGPFDSATPSSPRFRIGELPRGAEAQDWVTLVSCGTILEADMIRSQLESAGFPVFIPDEYLMTAASWGLNAYGYVRLQVRPANYSAARDLLCETGDAIAV